MRKRSLTRAFFELPVKKLPLALWHRLCYNKLNNADNTAAGISREIHKRYNSLISV